MQLGRQLTPFLLGAGVGYVRDRDHKKGYTKLSQQLGTWIEGGAAAIGLLSDTIHLPFSRDTMDAVGLVGAAFLGERVTRSYLGTGGFGSPAPMFIGGQTARPFMGGPSGVGSVGQLAAYPMASGFSQKEPSLTIY